MKHRNRVGLGPDWNEVDLGVGLEIGVGAGWGLESGILIRCWGCGTGFGEQDKWGSGVHVGGSCYFTRVARAGLTEKGMFEQTPEEGERGSMRVSSGTVIQAEGIANADTLRLFAGWLVLGTAKGQCGGKG